VQKRLQGDEFLKLEAELMLEGLLKYEGDDALYLTDKGIEYAESLMDKLSDKDWFVMVLASGYIAEAARAYPEEDNVVMTCFICGMAYSTDVYRTTCGKPECHEKLVQKIIAEYGEFKKVTRMSTGQTFKVPVRDIIEKGIREQELDKYPIWEEV
jgi:hypothetical protein